MKILFCVTPAFSHALPMVPLARGAETAGHQVLFAAGATAADAVREAGLPVIDPAPGADLMAPLRNLAGIVTSEGITEDETVSAVFDAFAEIGVMMADGMADIARRWGADLLVYYLMLPAGLVVARAVGIPAALHHIGLKHPAPDTATGALPALAAEWGVSPLPDEPDFEISLSPGLLDGCNDFDPGFSDRVHSLRMNPSCYNGGGRIPAWALSRGDRPRVLATLGSLPGTVDEGEMYAYTIRSTERMGAELVIAAPDSELARLPDPLPSHVRTAAWLPLNVVLPTCDVVLHHGGQGTGYAAYTAGVPQVCVPVTQADALTNAQVVDRVGAGLLLPPADVSADSIEKSLTQVISDPSYRRVSETVSREFRAMSAPHEVATALARAVGGS